MAIELNRFLALTVALAAGTACLSGCTVTDDDDDNGQAGSGNEQAGSGNEQAGSSNEQAGNGNTAGRQEEENGGASNAGASNAAGAGAANAGAANAGAANAGAAGAAQAGAPNAAGAANGGAAAAGAANGGAATAGAANAGAPNAGAAGATCLGADPAGELDCTTGFPTKDCSDDDPAYEGYLNLVVDACKALEYGAGFGYARPAVKMAAAECMAEIEVDPCSEDATAAAEACKADAAARACETSLAVAACGTDDYTDQWNDDTAAGILASCQDLSVEACKATMSALNDPIEAALCMDENDPTGEYFDASFEGTCTERFAVCSKF
jgi:hypothetical protein